MTRRFKVVLTLLLILGVGVFALLYFSAGLKEARAIKIDNISSEGKEDGFYKGSYEQGRWSGSIQVEIKDEKIVNISILKPIRDSKSDVGKTIAERVVERQDTDISVVTGATADSNIYLKAIEKALEN